MAYISVVYVKKKNDDMTLYDYKITI